MSKARRISVFRKDGSPLYDQDYKDQATGLSTSHQTLSADRLWPLIQVFVQFSREVQGGDVKRLVFRGPKAYAQTPNQFEALPLPSRPTPVTIVYLAHSERFVVTVTEQLIGDATTPASLLSRSEDSSNQVPDFCNSLLDYFNNLQSESTVLQEHTDVEQNSSPSSPARMSRSSFSSSSSSDSRIRLPVNTIHNDLPPPPSPPPQTRIDAAKVTDFVSKYFTGNSS